MTDNELSCEMTEFKRYLSPQLIGALNKLADSLAPPNWRQGVLNSKGIHLAVRSSSSMLGGTMAG
jgi:hypothetical protein